MQALTSFALLFIGWCRLTLAREKQAFFFPRLHHVELYPSASHLYLVVDPRIPSGCHQYMCAMRSKGLGLLYKQFVTFAGKIQLRKADCHVISAILILLSPPPGFMLRRQPYSHTYAGAGLNSVVEVSDRLILPHLICECNAARFAKYCLNSLLKTPSSHLRYQWQSDREFRAVRWAETCDVAFLRLAEQYG